MIFPEWTTFNIIFYISLAIALMVTGPAIYFGDGLLRYSKFRTASGIPSRLAMFILYFSPIVTLFFTVKEYVSNANLIQWVVIGSIGLHFSKRVLESLFLHKYSGPTGFATTIAIASFYSFAAFFISWLNAKPISKIDIWFWLGIVLYSIGIVGNFIHHKILVDLRKDSMEYFIPTGGYFKYVVCPHYLFEIFTWAGIFLFSRHLGALLVLLIMTAYLSARSLKTLKWYQEKFSDFPKNVKAMIPFVF